MRRSLTPLLALCLFTAAITARTDESPPPESPDAPAAESTAAAPSDRDQHLRTIADDAEIVATGRAAYALYCQSCHGEEGVSVDSPSNLFDPTWHHGDTPSAIETTVRVGVLEKGMPGWGEMLPAAEIEALVAYLVHFQPASADAHE